MPTFSVATKKKEGNNKRRMDGRERGRKERNIQKRNIFLYKYTEKERKEGRGKKKKKVLYKPIFSGHTCVSLPSCLYLILELGLLHPLVSYRKSSNKD